jgi:hypothetical protein
MIILDILYIIVLIFYGCSLTGKRERDQGGVFRIMLSLKQIIIIIVY